MAERNRRRSHETDRRGTVRRCAIAARHQNPGRQRAGKLQWRRTISSDQKRKIVELAYGSRILCRAVWERKKAGDLDLLRPSVLGVRAKSLLPGRNRCG